MNDFHVNDWLKAVTSDSPSSYLDPTPESLAIAARHGLIGLLADPEGAHFYRGAVPVYTRLAARQHVMDAHLRRLSDTLDQAGVRYAVLKGPWLGRKIYRNREHRTYTDLDIVVPKTELETALSALAQYEHLSSIPPRRPKADKREILIKDTSGMTFALDLHWDLFSYSQLRGDASHAMDELWEAAVKEPLGSGTSWSFPQHGVLAFLSTHAILDHRFRLILFRDLREMVERDIDAGALIDFAHRHCLRWTTYLALWLSRLFAGAPVGDDLLAELRPTGFTLDVIERFSPRLNLATFDGRGVHLVNLATVLSHDRFARRMTLAARAPWAVRGWKASTTENVKLVPADTTATDGARPRSAMIVLAGTQRRGAEVFGQQLAYGLRRHGWTVDLVSLRESNTETGVAAIPLSAATESATLRGFDFGLVGKLRSRIRERAPDVILAGGGATLKYAVTALAGVGDRPPLVYSSIGEPNYWARRLSSRMTQRILLSRTDLVIAVSQATADQLVDRFGLPTERVQVAYTGVPDDYLALRSQKSTADLHILVLGSLTPEKDPISALEVLARVDRPAVLRMIGEGRLLDAVQRAADSLGDRVEILGSVTDVRPHLQWANVLILTSRTEGLPGAILEAAAAGVPAVAFGVGGVGEAIEDGVTGFVVPSGDVDGLVTALTRFAEDPTLRSDMGLAARRKVERTFRLSDAVDRYRHILEEVMLAR